MVTAPFMIRRIEAMRPGIQQIVDGLIDEMLAGPKPVDLVEAFALPVPSLVICRLLGVPYADHDFFQRNTRILITRDTPPDERNEATRRLHDYLDHLVGDKLADPADDLLSQLAVERVRTGELTRKEVADLARLLLIAGHETTANMIALSAVTLLAHPGQVTLLREDPRLIDRAVEELLRFHAVIQYGLVRRATQDLALGGQQIRAGDWVVCSLASANRDEASCPVPAEFRVSRETSVHTSFGYGIHQCAGQHLARLELKIALSALLARFPRLQLAEPAAELPFRTDMFVYGVHRVALTW
jgi:hypothetical protein